MKESLKEILKQSDQNSKRGGTFSFYQYEDKKIICKKMLADLMSKKYSKKQNKRGFFMAENERNKIGVISQCLGLESLSLSQSFGHDMFAEEKSASETKEIVEETLKSIFADIDLTQDKVNAIMSGRGKTVCLIYEASPYMFNDDIDDVHLHVTDYTDTMAKLLETFSEFRYFAYGALENHGIVFNVEGADDAIRWAEAIMIKVIQDLNKVCIPQEEISYFIGKSEIKDKFGRGIQYKGWNYKDLEGDADPSLYFTYAVCSAYMSLVSNIPDTIAATREKEKGLTQNQLALKAIPILEFENDSKGKRDYEFLKHFYADFVDLNKRCVDAGRYVDTMIKRSNVDITQDFIGQGYTRVTTAEILNSTTNDSMINTLLAMLVMIYAGVDLDYASVGKGGDFSDQLHYSVQNVLKVYKKLARENKNYITDQLFLSFNEKFPSEDQEQVRLMRKQRILAMTLLPILVKTYTAISRYAIEYPQKEMGDYLEIILENRCIDKGSGTSMWIWDKDGYNLAVNFTYILNMLSFYVYYEKYEYPFTDDGESFNDRLRAQNDSHEKEINEIKTEYKQQVADLKTELAQAQNSLKELKPLEKEVIGVVEKYLASNLSGMLADAFKASRVNAIDGERDELSKAFEAIFISMIAPEKIKSFSDAGMSDVEGKWANNADYKENERIMFRKLSDFMLDKLASEKGIGLK